MEQKNRINKLSQYIKLWFLYSVDTFANSAKKILLNIDIKKIKFKAGNQWFHLEEIYQESLAFEKPILHELVFFLFALKEIIINPCDKGKNIIRSEMRLRDCKWTDLTGAYIKLCKLKWT